MTEASIGNVLVVDDTVDNLRLFSDLLGEQGYDVRAVTNGRQALVAAEQDPPDLILLDINMPDMNGYEVCRLLRAQERTKDVPVIFLTALTDTADKVRAFDAGGVDYVTKPIRPQEVIARMAVHMHSARQARQARNALDAFGHATIAVRLQGGAARLTWQTPLARRWLPGYFDSVPDAVPAALLEWLLGAEKGRDVRPLSMPRGARQLVCTLQGRTVDDDWLVVLREVSDAATVEATMLAFRLTLRESEVLYWVVKGKTNRDIGDILGSSPATVKKHLERVYEKLGVETRTAAAAMAIQRVRELNPA